MNPRMSHHPIVIWLLLICLAAYSFYLSKQHYRIWQYQQMLRQPETIPADDDDLPPELLFARARHQNQQGDYQQALRSYSGIEHSGSPELQLRSRYNMGVIYLQQAVKLWYTQGVWESSQINTLLDLAEQAFQSVLLTRPEHLPARYNLEFALRIRPPVKTEDETQWQKSKRSIHAIMPGIPGGGP